MKLWELSCPRVQGSHTTVTGWKETSICEMPILSDFASKYNTLMKMMTSTPVTLRIYFRKINVSVKLKATHIPERHHIIASTCCLKGSRRWHALCQNGLYHHLNAALISVQESKTAEKITYVCRAWCYLWGKIHQLCPQTSMNTDLQRKSRGVLVCCISVWNLWGSKHDVMG